MRVLPVVLLPDKTLQEIGTMMVRFNHLESILELVLIRMMSLRVDEIKSHIPFANMTFPQKMQILEAILVAIAMRNMGPEPMATFQKEIKPKLNDVNAQRNNIVHARWQVSNEGVVTASRKTANGKLEVKTQVISEKKIAKLNEQISAAANALWGLIGGDYPFKALTTKGAVSKALLQAMEKNGIGEG
jgi:hypothetical protein